ncbi:ketoacyl-ACP synthase III [Acetobacter senegalensis]|uniref:3-oxoacyl-ACP synthase III family protein n=1 Tax=Acetobacter senegalensis TaxID=446692 RepID=UPI00209F5655|nr:ketoacyl-ACP synthase III [Acetobacter senegalensis]MCP1197502.1 ketoacyl-ACP synthase III [Acetobacter senegalensis]
MTRAITGIDIRAIASAVPQHQVGSEEFCKMFPREEVERIAQGVGIHALRRARNLSTIDLMTGACQQILKCDAFVREDIDGLVVLTQTPHSWAPGASYQVHQRLGLREECLNVDMVGGCNGYVTGIVHACAMVASGTATNVLVCTGDTMSKLVDFGERQLSMLFGDGASATLITRGEGGIRFLNRVDPAGGQALSIPLSYAETESGPISATIGRLSMDGHAVMNFVLSRVPKLIADLLSAEGSANVKPTLAVFHQANAFIVGYLRRVVGMPEDKVLLSVDGYGNTSATSIPLAICSDRLSSTRDYSKTVLCGFGVGLNWGALVTDLSKTVRFPVIEIP